MIKTSSPVTRLRPLSFLAFALSALAGSAALAGCVEPEEKNLPQCAGSMEYCGSSCVEVVSSAIHCGRCSNSCPGDKVCTSGACKDVCDAGDNLCGQECANLLNNADHCGECFNKCAEGEICSNQACVCPAGQVCGVALGTGGVSGTGGAATGGAGSTTGTGGATGTGGVTGGGPGTGGAMSTGGNGSTGGTATGGTAGSGTGGSVGSTCTDNLPTDTDWPEATCADWMAQGHCQDDWLLEQNACERTCGRCTGNSGVGGGGSTGGGAGTGGTTSGQGNPWGGVTGGQQGWASRYWDCCKQSCGWGNNPVKSCGSDGNSGIGADNANVCGDEIDGNKGQSTTCNSFAPWAYSSEVSLGFAALHWSGAQCGTCYKVQFSGSSHNGGSDPGSQAIAGKVMIVMATNTGGDVGGGQMDFLIPGGGTGLYYGCDDAWGISSGEKNGVLGPDYGGFRAGCSGDHNAIKACVRNKCDEVFGPDGRAPRPDLHDGCLWYVDWFQAADNPNFTYEQISCPQELTGVAY